MKRLSSYSKRVVNNVVKAGQIEWELRPGGMLVQKRNPGRGDASSGPMIKIKVSHGAYHHDIAVPAQSTFGNHFLTIFPFLSFAASFFLGFILKRVLLHINKVMVLFSFIPF